MPKDDNYSRVAERLQSITRLLRLDQKSQLYRDVMAISHQLTNPNFQIAVFGPFNHGKSTLLNAMLGNRALPIDLIPTTGAAIAVKYGSQLETRIILANGTEICRSGTEVLKQFAILDKNRRMREDVVSVEVFCPDPFLQTGVELLDLPGTNDREAQDNLVRDKLLSADLVVQLLDARKLMTLGERENLRDWLLDRGIKTVIFVANFMNLLEIDEQKQVQNRLRFVAESFRTDLPTGFSNLYRVDALPALRARLKGDVAAANSSGLAAFETALQNMVAICAQNRDRSPRVKATSLQLQRSLTAKITPVAAEIAAYDDKNDAKNEIKQKAATLIQQGFATSLVELRGSLALPILLTKYQNDAAIALANSNFQAWERSTFKKDFAELQSALERWLNQAYDFFQEARPQDLYIPFPPEPQISLPPKPSGDSFSEPGAIAAGGGIGWLLGGPVGAAVVASISYLANQNIQKQDDQLATASYAQEVAKICFDAAGDYLSRFSRQGLSILADYENHAKSVIRLRVSREPIEMALKREDLQHWQNTFNQLLQDLAKVNIQSDYQPYVARKKQNSTQKVEPPHTNVSTPPRTTTPPPSPPTPSPRTTTPPPSPSRTTTPQPCVENRTQTSPSSNVNLEAKFRNFEIDEEIARMKAEMRNGTSAKQSPNNHSASQSSNSQKQASTNNHNASRSSTSGKQASNQKAATLNAQIARAYTLLGLTPSASAAEVKQAYRVLVKKWHPDLFVHRPQMQQEAQQKLQIVNEAYTLLCQHT